MPFGEDWVTEGDDKNAPKYNSQELDKESGYYFYNARHYDPEIARFVTPDTVIDGEGSTQGWNRFAYCKGNPIIYKDPTGHMVGGILGGMSQASQLRETKPDTSKTRAESFTKNLINSNTDKTTGKRNYITDIKIPPGTNLKIIAEGLNNYYKTDLFNEKNIAENNKGKPGRIKAGDTINIDPAKYMINSKFFEEVTTNPSNLEVANQIWDDTKYQRQKPEELWGEALGTIIINKFHCLDNWRNRMLESRERIIMENFYKQGLSEKMLRESQQNRLYDEIKNYYKDTNRLPETKWGSFNNGENSKK